MATPISTVSRRSSSWRRAARKPAPDSRPNPRWPVEGEGSGADAVHHHFGQLVGDLVGCEASVGSIPAEQIVAHADHPEHHDARVHCPELAGGNPVLQDANEQGAV